MNEVKEFFKISLRAIISFFSPKEDETDLNLLLKKLLDDKSLDEILILKKSLDIRFSEILKTALDQRNYEADLIEEFINKQK